MIDYLFEIVGEDSDCCGERFFVECAKDENPWDVVAEYFDDEELDKFAGRPSDTYGDSEAELFADVLYTMRPDEVAAWMRSLNLRGINLPDQLKDEVILLIGDNR